MAINTTSPITPNVKPVATPITTPTGPNLPPGPVRPPKIPAGVRSNPGATPTPFPSNSTTGRSNVFPTSPDVFSNPLGQTVDLKREAFNRRQFDDTINTNFTELGPSSGDLDLSFFDPSLATVGDFFTIYNTLFYQIPKSGVVNSHEFLIRESTEYTQYIAQQEEIEALTQEITDLREQNVILVKDMTQTLNEISELDYTQ